MQSLRDCLSSPEQAELAVGLRLPEQRRGSALPADWPVLLCSAYSSSPKQAGFAIGLVLREQHDGGAFLLDELVLLCSAYPSSPELTGLAVGPRLLEQHDGGAFLVGQLGGPARRPPGARATPALLLPSWLLLCLPSPAPPPDPVITTIHCFFISIPLSDLQRMLSLLSSSPPYACC